MSRIPHPHRRTCRRHGRRGFSLVELLVALAITSALLTATLVALNASFMAYQATTREASTHTIARLTMHRMLTLLRTGTDFGPFPASITANSVIQSDFIEFFAANGQLMRLEYIPEDEALYIVNILSGGIEESHLLLAGVTQRDEEGDYIPPFTLEFVKGTQLYRASIDLTLVPDDNLSLQLEGEFQSLIRLVGSAMPRHQAF